MHCLVHSRETFVLCTSHLDFPLSNYLYSPSVSCCRAAEAADFAGKTTKNSVTISMDMPSIEVPLPLNDDTEIEQNETFLCFFTSKVVSVRRGRVTLIVTDDNISKSAFTKSEDM